MRTLARYAVSPLLAILLWPTTLPGQITSSVVLGDRYQTVLAKIRDDPNASTYQLMQPSKGMLLVTSNLNSHSVIEYRFLGERLVNVLWVNDANPEGAMRLLTENALRKYGEPALISVEGSPAKHWKDFHLMGGSVYYYIAWSPHFSHKALHTLVK